MFKVSTPSAGSALCHTLEQANKLADEIYELFHIVVSIEKV